LDGTIRGAGELTPTYVIPGHVVSTGSRAGPEYVEEKIGRGREERVKRKREEKATEAMLNKMLGSGSRTGAGMVQKARAVMKELKGGKTATTAAVIAAKAGRGYSAEAIKKLGFDPGAKRGQKGDFDTRRKVSWAVFNWAVDC
jgi:minichromosome maintenance protein 10